MNLLNDKKVCTKCKKEKLLEEFGRSPQVADGRTSWCISCQAEANKLKNDRRQKEKNFYKQFSPI